MKPTRCPSCQSDELTFGSLTGRSLVSFRQSLFKSVAVRSAACLACGAVIPYLDVAALAQLRTWNGKKQPVNGAVNEL